MAVAGCQWPVVAATLLLTTLLPSRGAHAAGCPHPAHLPDLTAAGTEVLCARLYQRATPLPWTSCGGEWRDVPDGDVTPVIRREAPAWDNEISSLVARPRCTFTGWERARFKGKRFPVTGMRVISLGFVRFDDCISSYTCTCDHLEPAGANYVAANTTAGATENPKTSATPSATETPKTSATTSATETPKTSATEGTTTEATTTEVTKTSATEATTTEAKITEATTTEATTTSRPTTESATNTTTHSVAATTTEDSFMLPSDG